MKCNLSHMLFRSEQSSTLAMCRFLQPVSLRNPSIDIARISSIQKGEWVHSSGIPSSDVLSFVGIQNRGNMKRKGSKSRMLAAITTIIYEAMDLFNRNAFIGPTFLIFYSWGNKLKLIRDRLI